MLECEPIYRLVRPSREGAGGGWSDASDKEFDDVESESGLRYRWSPVESRHIEAAAILIEAHHIVTLMTKSVVRSSLGSSVLSSKQ